MTRIEALLALGLDDTNLTKAKIVEKYKALSRNSHTDKLVFKPGTTEEEKKRLTNLHNARFNQINEAKDFLLNSLMDQNKPSVIEYLHALVKEKELYTEREQALTTLGFRTTDKPAIDDVKVAYWRISQKCHPNKYATRCKANENYSFFYDDKEAFTKLALAMEYFHEQDTNFQNTLPQSRNYKNKLDFAKALYTAYFGKNESDPKFATPYYIDVKEKYKFYEGTSTFVEYDNLYRMKFSNKEELVRLCQFCFTYFLPAEITIDKFKLPKNGAEIIFQALLKRSSATKVNVPDNFFTQDQKTQLNQHWQELKKKQKNEPQSSFDLSSRFLFIAKAAIIGITINLSSIVGSIAAFIFLAREIYMGIARKQYNSVAKIDNVKDAVEIQALQAGLEAQTWKGYLNSFKLKCTYQRPGAFYSALQANDEAITQKIRAMAP